MELTREQIDSIKEQISKNISIREVLLQYPNARISIIRGYDNFSYEAYTKGAFFDEEQAKRVMAEIPPNGDPRIADTYHIVIGTVKELEEGLIKDLRTKRPLDGVDMSMVYNSLEMLLN